MNLRTILIALPVIAACTHASAETTAALQERLDALTDDQLFTAVTDIMQESSGSCTTPMTREFGRYMQGVSRDRVFAIVNIPEANQDALWDGMDDRM